MVNETTEQLGTTVPSLLRTLDRNREVDASEQTISSHNGNKTAGVVPNLPP
ncbi:hypothetical protein RISK_003647 [Rhodopirellula islandica]|uniref:Uncharacterized protein n=1 Tax=Rhodopirellula islandica TaxID=595434 RepID=A0A0J1BDB4_RHOIS|nr:hypothetical protein RISK_003647 [Rhodopirellula islandica]